MLPFPVALLRALGRLGDVVAQARPFPLTTEAVDRLVGSLEVDGSRLVQRTGYTRPYTLAEGLRITAEWYRRRSGAGR